MKRYDPVNYTCVHYLQDKYYELTGERINLLSNNIFDPRLVKNFHKVNQPKELTIVLFRNRTKSHVGLFHNNRVYHLDEFGEVCQHLSIASKGFNRVDFYEANRDQQPI